MSNEKKIEIPFGAFDSELIRQEINIPNGFKAVIDGNKIIFTRAERGDEKVRKALAEMVHDTTGDGLWVDYNVHKEEALAWLEKQGGQKPDWSIKEKLMLNDIIETTERSNIFKENYQRELIDWLKSLKERIGG